MYKIKPISSVKAQIPIGPDKSIFQRAIIISSIAEGKTNIKPFIINDDIKVALDCIKRLGISVKVLGNNLIINGGGLYFPTKEKITLYANQSATTLRILSGVLCGQKFSSYFDASTSLRKRPMSRTTIPLRMMGADISGIRRDNEEYPPLIINPVEELKPIEYTLPVVSAQVKSAIILASLYTKGKTKIFEPYVSRDHTERMLSFLGVKLIRKDKLITLQKITKLISKDELFIPSDFSSAAIFIVLALILENSQIILKNININPTRCGILKVLKRMGANIKIINKKNYFEPYADILVKSSSLVATNIKISEIPSVIDEIPIFCIAASFAKGVSYIYGVKELSLKESDRIRAIVVNLQKIGINIEVEKFTVDGREDLLIKIRGRKKHKNISANFESFSDHRIAMSMIVLGKALKKESYIDNIECINKSFPQFISIIDSL